MIIVFGACSGLPQIIGCVAMALDLNRMDLEMIVKIISNSHGLLTGKEFNKINCIYVTMSCVCVRW